MIIKKALYIEVHSIARETKENGIDMTEPKQKAKAAKINRQKLNQRGKSNDR